MSEPYDPQNPDMPPLINDVIFDREKLDAQAEKTQKAAQEIGFTGNIETALAGVSPTNTRACERPPTPQEEMANGEPAPAPPPAIYPIAALSFRVAKTMPEIPHEYTVRSPEKEAAYVALFNLIVEHGVFERWGGRRYQYWYPGDGWKYWRMDNDIRTAEY